MTQTVDPYAADMKEPWHRDLVLAIMTGSRERRELDDWAREVALVYSRTGTLEVTALVWSLLGEIDRLRELAEWLVSLDDCHDLGTVERRTAAMGEAITRARKALGKED